MSRDIATLGLASGRNSESAETEPTPERSDRLASLLMLSYEPMLVWRLGGAIEFWNTGAERLYGYSSSEAVGAISGELHHICKNGREVTVRLSHAIAR